MSRPTEILIDEHALISNTKLAQALCPDSQLIAVIKADAYGHGAVDVARILQHRVSMFAVSSTQEAIELRSADIKLPILLLEGCFSSQELQTCIEQGFEPVTHNLFQVEMLLNSDLKGKLNLWLKVDTGMHRLGLPPEQVNDAFDKLRACSLVADIRILTHLSNADVISDPSTLEQLECFDSTLEKLNKTFSVLPQTSIANSAGLLCWPQSHREWARPGIMLYGLSPTHDAATLVAHLTPVMTFRSQVIAIRQVAKGQSVGYGNTWIAAEDAVIATVAVGYGDGYPRNAKSGTPVLVNGQRCSLAGRVSMDMISVDVSDLTEVNIGDPVELWGANLSANEVAQWADTIGYELVTRLPKRTPRKLIR